MNINNKDTAVPLTDAQNDFLSEQGCHLGVGRQQRQGEQDCREHREAFQSRQGQQVRGLHLPPLLLPHRSRLEVRGNH